MKVCRSDPTTTGSSTCTPFAAQLVDHPVEVVHEDREVLAEVGRNASLDEVQLRRPEVDPGATDAEVGPVPADRAPEDIGVEGHALGRVGDVEGHMVDGERLHGTKYRLSRPEVNPGVTRSRRAS